jgi:PAS domain S-box-containing protein
MPVKPARRLLRWKAAPHEAIAQALLADSDAGVLVVDPDGRAAAVSPALARMLALTPARARGRAARDLVRTPVAGDDPVRDAFRAASTERDAVLVTHGGGELPALLRSRRLGQPGWVVLTVRDLTQMRRLQQELRRNERLATLGQLSAGVAHEIRNPLAGISTSARGSCA